MKYILGQLLCIALVCFSAMSMFFVKYATIGKERELQMIANDIYKNKGEIHVLTAEWAHLTNPDRLRALIHQYTQLETIKPSQIVTIPELELRQSTETQSTHKGKS